MRLVYSDHALDRIEERNIEVAPAELSLDELARAVPHRKGVFKVVSRGVKLVVRFNREWSTGTVITCYGRAQ
jgi:hypothetical protein